MTPSTHYSAVEQAHARERLKHLETDPVGLAAHVADHYRKLSAHAVQVAHMTAAYHYNKDVPRDLIQTLMDQMADGYRADFGHEPPWIKPPALSP